MEQHLPPSLLHSLQHAQGFDAKDFIHVHQQHESIVSIRTNPTKPFNIAASVLQIDTKVPWNTNGFYLTERPSFTIDPLFHCGAYYVQEASSMFLEQALHQTCDLTKALKVLDLCAAPGGKSTLIQSLISKDSLLVSNEVIKTRVNVLSENLTKWGAVNVVVTNNDPRDFQQLSNYFDVIVVDAPCSGSGLFRKDPDAINEWSEQNVLLCSQRQQRILADIMVALKPGGILIYSTCSFSMEEDEAIADWLTIEYALESMPIQLNEEWNIVETKSPKANAAGYRFYPDKLKGEGFFLAAFKKNKEDRSKGESTSKNSLELMSKAELASIQHWIKDFSNLSFFKWKQECITVPTSILKEIILLQSCLYLRKVGINMGAIIRNELIPTHDLAMSTMLSNHINEVELTYEQALQYLRKADLALDHSIKGWSLITFGGLALGLAKILPNRINNYYPKEWRILNK